MKCNIKEGLVGLIFVFSSFGCVDNSSHEISKDVDANNIEETNETINRQNLFDSPNELINSLSKNGIGNLKAWSNPMDLGWGSLTEYYQFGVAKDGVGMQNNIAYYIEGTENEATKLYINLNLNNPSDKKDALKFLSEIAVKTFKTLNIEMPKGLSDAILTSKQFQMDVDGYSVSNQLDKSKIETWKVIIERK